MREIKKYTKSPVSGMFLTQPNSDSNCNTETLTVDDNESQRLKSNVKTSVLYQTTELKTESGCVNMPLYRHARSNSQRGNTKHKELNYSDSTAPLNKFYPILTILTHFL